MDPTHKLNKSSHDSGNDLLSTVTEKARNFKRMLANQMRYFKRRPKMRWEVLTGLIPPDSQGAEIGSAEGKTTSYILTHRKDVKLFSIDPYFNTPGYEDEYYAKEEHRRANDWNSLDWCERESDRVLAPFVADGRCIRIKKTSREAVTAFANESLDFIFIDGNHSYEYVREDMELWYPVVKRNGLFSGHDYGYSAFPDVKRAVDEFANAKQLRIQVYDDYVWRFVPD